MENLYVWEEKHPRLSLSRSPFCISEIFTHLPRQGREACVYVRGEWAGLDSN